MVTVPTPESREIIARRPFLNSDLGELMAWHDDEGPIIYARLAPEDSGQEVVFCLTPTETPHVGRSATRPG
jgi:hypothetical protein